MKNSTFYFISNRLIKKDIIFKASHKKTHFWMDTSWWGAVAVVSWQFDLTDYGFDPNTQDVISAEVVLDLSDDWDWWPEYATFIVGTDYDWWEVDTGDFSFTITSFVTLSDSGTVDCTLTVIWGDFYFNGATLYAEGTQSSTASVPSPEPGTILLLGTGLVGLAGLGKKKLIKTV